MIPRLLPKSLARILPSPPLPAPCPSNVLLDSIIPIPSEALVLSNAKDLAKNLSLNHRTPQKQILEVLLYEVFEETRR